MKDPVGAVNENFQDPTGRYEYYNAENIYEYVSYWDNEIYRYGVVFILDNYTLSPVFNIRGGMNLPLDEGSSDILDGLYTDPHAPLYDANGNRVYIQTEDDLIKGGKRFENNKGVVRFNVGKSIISV
jgi:hypothetical protein